MAKYAGKDFTFSYSTDDGTSYTAIDQIVDIDLDGGDIDFEDVTTHDSTNDTEEVVSTIKRPGTVTVNLIHDPDSAAHDYIAKNNATLVKWKLVYTDTGITLGDVVFNGYIGQMSRSLSHSGAVTASFTVRKTGADTIS